MSAPKPAVMLDSNDAQSEALLHAMQAYYGKSGLAVTSLPVDIVFHTKRGQVLIERKVTPSDLLASMGDGRLKDQVFKLMGAEAGGALLLEGALHCAPDGRIIDGRRTREWTMMEVWGHLMTIQDAGVKLLFSPSPAVTPMVIHEAYIWFSKEPEEHTSLKSRTKPKSLWGGSPSEREATLFAFQGFGLGPKTAEQAWRKSVTLRSFVNMTTAQRTSIKGIGQERDKKVTKILDKEYPHGND